MKTGDAAALVLLGALWGGSYLFMRVAVPEFGPVALIELRVLIAALFLLPFLAAARRWGELAAHARPLFVMGVVNSALPFSLIAYSTLSLTAGFAAILNATSPFFAAAVAYAWLGERLSPVRIAGLAIGFAGVTLLLWDEASLGAEDALPAVAAAFAAAFLYGLAANYSKVRLAPVHALAAATGSQLAAAVFLAPAVFFTLPSVVPSAQAWAAVIALGVISTGLAYVLYFRLIVSAGATRAIVVTFLIPLFGVLWGLLALDEAITVNMALGTVIILTGTAMTTGIGPRVTRDESQLN